MPPLPVVEQVNVFADFARGFGARLVVTMMHEFVFQRAPETLYGGTLNFDATTKTAFALDIL